MSTTIVVFFMLISVETLVMFTTLSFIGISAVFWNISCITKLDMNSIANETKSLSHSVSLNNKTILLLLIMECERTWQQFNNSNSLNSQYYTQLITNESLIFISNRASSWRCEWKRVNVSDNMLAFNKQSLQI